ncbi:dynein regulatory complex protein 9 [Pelobates fuscus]|uniref:dynein regulatory complex protein 9 n=1 Tax=Pelobates fuscus TaxID=191477 RepID=UPI002FE481DB
MTSLSTMDILHVCTVLEDSLDQLSILGYTMIPVSYHGRRNIVINEIGNIMREQRQLEKNVEELIGSRIAVRLTSPSSPSMLADLTKEVQETSEKLKISNEQFTRAVKQGPLTSDNLKKIQAENLKKVQADRQFAADIIMEMLKELEDSRTFISLQEAVEKEKERKDHFRRTIEREEDGRYKINLLQKQLEEIRKEKEVELQNRNELIAHLNDQLQETIAKTNIDNKYAKKDTELQISQTQKRCSISETNLLQEIETIQIKTDEEIRAHLDIENFQRQHLQELEAKLEHWMEKCDKDAERKEDEIQSMKKARDKDLALLQTLAERYKEYERVITEDRLEKEKARQEKRQAQLELDSTIKIQAWWRGMMVRKGLGAFKKAKSKKGKGKGKKGKAKKGGKKK